MSQALARKETAAVRTLDHEAVDKAIAQLEAAMGGRQDLLATLAHAPQTDDLAYVINLIADPRSDARSLAAICRAGHVHPGELLEAYKRGKFAKMQVQAIATIAEKTPAVVSDVMDRAAPHLENCPSCKGTQWLPNPQWKPDGEQERWLACSCTLTTTPGFVAQVPTVERQKLALDLAQLTPQKGPQVVVDNRTQVANRFDASPSGFSALLSETDEILHRRRGSTEVVDAEITDPSVDEAEPAE